MFQSIFDKYFHGDTSIPTSLNCSLTNQIQNLYETQNFKIFNATTNQKLDANLFIYNKNKSDFSKRFDSNHFTRLKTVRHPNILKIIGSTETDGAFYLLTEACTPLIYTEIGDDPSWGLHQLITALHFVNENCKLTHGLICPLSIYVTPDGAWKLSAFDCCCDRRENYAAVISTVAAHPIYNEGWRPPTVASGNTLPSLFVDRWGLASVICWVYSVIHRKGISKDSLKRIEMDPTVLQKYAPKLLQLVVKELMSPQKQLRDLSVLLKKAPYFTKSKAVEVMLFISEADIKGVYEKENFYKMLSTLIPSLPKEILKQIIPELVKRLKMESDMLPYIIQSLVLSHQMIEQEEMSKTTVDAIVEKFKSTDRAIRYTLLENFEFLEKSLSKRILNFEIFTPLMYGFMDTSPQIRESTVKAVFHLLPRLTRSRAEEVSQYMLRLLKDEDATIRTNTTICFAKCADPLIRFGLCRVLVGAYCASLCDPFGPCRLSTLQAISATANYFSPLLVAREILPAVCKRLIDLDDKVRNTSFETVDYLVQVLQQKLVLDTIENYTKQLEQQNEMGGKEGWLETLTDVAKMVGSSLGIKALDFYDDNRKGEANGKIVTGDVSHKYADKGQITAAATTPSKPTAASPPSEETFYDIPLSTKEPLDDEPSDNAWDDDDIDLSQMTLSSTTTAAAEKISPAATDATPVVNNQADEIPQRNEWMRKEVMKPSLTSLSFEEQEDQFFKEFEDSLKSNSKLPIMGLQSKSESNKLSKPFLNKSLNTKTTEEKLMINMSRSRKMRSKNWEDELDDL